ncbi:pirin family protein [Dictyostelium discoideum AX4]|uniref:Pirin family protein n=1 Tax=Dictyostelium discoideum TaxID=44689 RepID=Q54UE9_DICDI|nr:pirin family protein [Dictyostelium discoideum AX4]EAL66854.1 pirin family protein [Dictyostelium discoideum AX4]|eukprot:XP_640827.1 pirin family protein [Dictyostelium discoideum AX4]
MSSVSRKVSNVAKGYKTKDGAGVSLLRVIGGPIPSKSVDPFLMLDAFKSENPNDYIAGFPSHPHRGQQTLTYMIDGIMEHKDNKGNKGLLKPGMVQVMNAARGIIHSEMPKQVEGKMFGFQFWLNLAAVDKMSDPWYKDIPAEEIPEVITNDKKVRVVAGHYEGVEGIVKGLRVNPIFLDVTLSPNTKFSVDIPNFDHNSFVYVFEGEGKFGPEGYEKVVADQHIGVLENKDRVTINDNEITPNKLDAIAGENGVRFLFLSAKPLREPIVQHGPFVMNTQKEIQQAFFDYQMGRF